MSVTDLQLHRTTALGRPIDPAYRSNRLAIAGSVLTALTVIVGNAVLPSVLDVSPIASAVAVFLAWAIGRELDPDHPASAAIAMTLSFAAIVLIGVPSLLLGTAVLLGTRLISGTAGTRLRPLDVVVLIAMAAVLGTQSMVLPGAAVLIAGVLVIEHASPRGILIGLAMGIVSTGVAVASGTAAVWAMPKGIEWLGAVMIGAATVAVIPATRPDSMTDAGDQRLSRGRVTAARIAGGLTVLAGFIVAGGLGITAAAATVGAALVGIAATSLRTTAREGNAADRGIRHSPKGPRTEQKPQVS